MIGPWRIGVSSCLTFRLGNCCCGPRPLSRGRPYAAQMSSRHVSLRSNARFILLVAVAAAGLMNAGLAAIGMVTTYFGYLSFVEEEFGGTFTNRSTALDIAWEAQSPFLVVGLAVGIVGTTVLFKYHRRPEDRPISSRPVLAGVALAIPLAVVLSLLTLLALLALGFREA